MPIVYVVIFFVSLIIYMAVFLFLMKKTTDACTTHLKNMEMNYPHFYSENRPSMTRSGKKREFLADYSESGYMIYRNLIWRFPFPVIRSEAAKFEYSRLKRDSTYKELKLWLLLHGCTSLFILIAFWIWGSYYLLPALTGV